MSTRLTETETGETKVRHVRVGTTTWAKATWKAQRQGRSIAEVVRAFLVDFTDDVPDNFRDLG